MGFGNLVAPFQSSMIRLMAYSSVGQIGYLLLGVAALAAASEEPRISVEQSHLAVRGVLLQLVAFAVATTAAFLAITAFHSATGKQKIVDFAGMARLSPIMTAALAASLLSLAGVPILAGFVGKLYLFKAAWEQGLQWSVGLAILASLGSLYYFLRVVLRLYVEPSTEAAPIPVPRMTLGVLGVLLLGMVFLGVYPVPLVEAIEGAGNSLLSSEGVMRLLRSLD
jgi:NADH-quinone oxidoreductase subunit N